jgi:hypothetical protein
MSAVERLEDEGNQVAPPPGPLATAEAATTPEKGRAKLRPLLALSLSSRCSRSPAPRASIS